MSECGLDDEAPTVHLVMRLPAPGTARRKREPVLGMKGGLSTPNGQVQVKAEPGEDDDLAAMSYAGIRQLSDMLLDGDQMEFEQVRFFDVFLFFPSQSHLFLGRMLAACIFYAPLVSRTWR